MTKIEKLKMQLKEAKEKEKAKKKILKEREALKIGKAIQKIVKEDIDFDKFNDYITQHSRALKNLKKD